MSPPVRDELRAAVQRASAAALAAVDPRAAVRQALEAEPLPGPVRVLALGKASAAMVAGALDALGAAVRGGLAVSPPGTAGEPAFGPVRRLFGEHPLPGEASAAAGRALLEEAAQIPGGESVLVLVSGGASALAAVPIAGLGFEDLRTAHEALLRSGAPIEELNAVRRVLSSLHGGGLSRAVGARPARTLLLSDVPGDAVRDIGSGPMEPGLPSRNEALAVLRRRLPPGALLRRLTLELESSGPPEPAPPGARSSRVVASGRDARAAAARCLRSEGFLVEEEEEPLTGDAERRARLAVRRLAASGRGARALVLAGEPTVAVRGTAAGGRCRHAALAAACEAHDRRASGRELVFLALATDGRDGSDDRGGAVVDGGTLTRLRAAGRDAASDLEHCRSALALEATGDALPGSATGTNVADLWIAAVDETAPRLAPLEEARGLEFRGRPTRPPSPAALLVEATLGRSLQRASATHDGAALCVLGAWDPGEPLRADGRALVVAPPSEPGRRLLAAAGLRPCPGAEATWRCAEPPHAALRPSWAGTA